MQGLLNLTLRDDTLTAELVIGSRTYMTIAPARGKGELEVFAAACRLRSALSNQTVADRKGIFDPTGFYNMVLSAYDGRPVQVKLSVGG